MILPVYQIVFYCFAALLIGASAMVVISRNPVRALLFLVLAFFACAVLWMLLQAEFLALVLIFVYVGAVMTLFLFVVMMLNIDLSAMREGFVKFLPYAVIVMVLLIGAMIMAFGPKHLSLATVLPVQHGPDYSNVKAMGTLLFTHYLYAFEIAAAILLVAMVSAIALAFHGRREGTKSQSIAQQHQVTKQDRLRKVDLKKQRGDA